MTKFFNKKQNSKQKGFTLIEILVAFLVLSMVITATSSILALNLSSAISIKNSFIASGLVQEGVEVVRNIRDTAWFTGVTFDDSIPDGIYRVQWNSTFFISLGTNPILSEDGPSGIYSYDNGTATIYSRVVNVATIVPNVEKKVTVTVNWTERGVAKSISAEDHFFNWR